MYILCKTLMLCTTVQITVKKTNQKEMNGYINYCTQYTLNNH